MILSLLFLAAYYFVYYKAQALITLLVENAAVYGMKIRGSAYLLYLFGCVGAGDWLAMLIVTVTQAALLAPQPLRWVAARKGRRRERICSFRRFVAKAEWSDRLLTC